MLRLIPLLFVLAACTPTSTEVSMPTPSKSGELPPPAVTRSDEEWRKTLTPMQYAVLRQSKTERAFTGEYDEKFDPGVYSCAACGQELFASTTKFNSGCGWPAFYASAAADRVILRPDPADGNPKFARTEVLCSRCHSHLGHVFDDAPKTPTGNRYCINSVALKFTPAK